MKLNSDMGESFGPWILGADEALMPFIDLASIACGMHASEPVTMQRTIALSRTHGARVGAHPGYPDRVGFGRRPFPLAGDELQAYIVYQIGALDGLCRAQGCRVEYVKPHGALYNRMMADAATLDDVLRAVRAFDVRLPLVVQAGDAAANDALRERAAPHGVNLWFEAFADRAYADDGRLAPRTVAGAVHDRVERIVAQALELARDRRVATLGGGSLHIDADTLCIHGDTPGCALAAQRIRAELTCGSSR